MTPEPLPRGLDAIPIQGRNLVEGPLRRQWGEEPALLVFLRHLGCIFCREFVAELKRRRGADPSFPETIFIHPATTAEGDEFFGAELPEAKAIADPKHELHHAFGLARGTLGQVFGPGPIACGIRAYRAGHRQGKPAGDPWLMPGYRLVAGDRVLWRFDPSHIGSHPDLDEIARIAAASHPTRAV